MYCGFFVLVSFILGIVFGLLIGFVKGLKEVQDEAVKNGVGVYYIRHDYNKAFRMRTDYEIKMRHEKENGTRTSKA